MGRKRVDYNSKTLQYMRSLGYMIETVEKYNSFTKQRKDLFGIIDMVAISDQKTVGVQSTSQLSHSAHVNKLYWWTSNDGRAPNLNTKAWLSAGRELWLVCWAKKKIKRGGVAYRYEPLVTNIKLSDLVNAWSEESSDSCLSSDTTNYC